LKGVVKPLIKNFHAKQFPKRCYSSILLLKSQEVVLLLAPLLSIETFFALFNWKSMNLKKSQLKPSQQNKTHNQQDTSHNKRIFTQKHTPVFKTNLPFIPSLKIFLGSVAPKTP